MTDPAILSEQELINKFRGEELTEREFYSVLFDRYYPFLMEYGRKWLWVRGRNDIELEDLVQSTFIDVFSLIRKSDLKSSFRTWLVSVFRSKASHELLKRGPENYIYLDELEASDPRLEKIAVEESKIDDAILNDEQFKAISELLSKELLPEENTLIMLHLVEDMTPSEIAEALNESPEKIRHSLNRVMAKLRYRLKHKLKGNKSLEGQR